MGLILISFGLILIGLIFAFLYVSIELVILNIRLEKHPILINILNNYINNILNIEDIKKFNVEYDELNVGLNKEDKIVGRYVYTLDEIYQNKANKLYFEINSIEKVYNKSIIEIQKELSTNYTPIIKEKIFLPRIELAEKFLMKLGLDSYYDTYLHELGHHFALKKIGNNHNENDADIEAANLIVNISSMKLLFKAIFRFRFNFNLTVFEKIKFIFIYSTYKFFNRKLL